ncbi:DUF3806 domain-containing protein [Gilvimarinus japonicus]|uniref:DUF3806 domain-containing protein n=1 Tax=Gilvimarinus japonicus TaxID=1796469 RepID=A0ABV7HPD1_9GAMM
MNKLLSSAVLLLVMISPCSHAQIDPQFPTVEALSWTDSSYLAKQRARVDRLTRENTGTPIRGDKSDLNTLQRVVDRELVANDDKLTLQALGVVLADVMLSDEPALAWKIYEDRRGRSRALCINDTKDCLFPVTMLSRRMKVGLKPDVKKVYVEAMELVGAQLPELPYGEKREYLPY